jgi:eukaryotic-like serine/threonine-protein kinase
VTQDLTARLQLGLGHAYRIERELGGGGMSRVYAATETALDRTIVLKVLPPELGQALSTDRFRQEIRLAARLQHLHIVPLLSAGEADGLLYYTMPFVEGESLRARLARAGELPVREAVKLLTEVAEALAYAHEHGVVHRDIKPDNVLLSGRHALVTDFGVAKALSAAATPESSGLTSLGVALGTPAYMAPEQGAADPHVDHRADLYAWGCLAYECLTGEPPFTGRSPQGLLAAHMTVAPEPVERRRAGMPPALASVVMRCLEKRPADRPQSAAELLPLLEAVVTPSGGMAPTVPIVSTTAPGPKRRLRWGATAAGVAIAGAVGAAVLNWHRSPPPVLGATLVAVAPFDVLDPGLSLWREGMVDVLSRSLDGAGPLRTVSPSVVVQRWKGRADRVSAAALGQATGAGLVVFGTLQSGGDSVRADVTLFDAKAGRVIGEVTAREAQARLDRLGDSLTVALLRKANQATAVTAARNGGLGGRSLPALKAYLRGEQQFRHAQWDSARVSLEEARSLDNAFPLALWRLGQVYGWIGYSGDSTGVALGLQAGALNHGLAPRDSLLVLSDSLMGALERPGGTDLLPMRRRLLATTAEGIRRYPEDPQSWYEYGEARFHYGNAAEQTDAEVTGAFRRAIALDPEFAPAYYHVVQASLRVFGPDTVRRYATAMLTLQPDSGTTEILRTTLELLEPGGTSEEHLRRILARKSARVLQQAGLVFHGYGDTAETGLKLLRGWGAKRGPNTEVLLAYTERLYGRMRQSRELLERVQFGVNDNWRGYGGQEHGLLGSALPQSFEAAAARSLSGPFRPDSLPMARVLLPVWAGKGDTVPLRRYAHISDSLSRLSNATAPVRREPPLVRAYLALARRDSASALRQMLALSDTLYDDCPLRLSRANLLAAAGRDSEAAELLERSCYPGLMLAPDVLRMMQRGRVAERLGRRQVAVESYQWVARIWRNADPELQPYVTEARTAIARLTAERS